MAQLASASGLGPEGPVFESQYPDLEERNRRNSVSLFSFSAAFRVCRRPSEFHISVKCSYISVTGNLFS